MRSEAIGRAVRRARQQLGISMAALATRAGVSLRLVAEFERGERPNVSLETVLTLLELVNCSVIVGKPGGAEVPLVDADGSDGARAARAALRRATWTGRVIPLHAEGDAPRPPRTAAERLSAVAELSEQGYRLAAAAPGRGRVTRDGHGGAG